MPRKSIALPALPLLVTAVLAGCAAVGPDYRAPEPTAPQAWSRSLADDAALQPAAIARWWERLGDPMIAPLVERALQDSPDVRAAQAKVRAARAQRALAAAQFAPVVGAGVSASASRAGSSPGTATLYDAGFDASWEIDVFGGLRRGLEAADADLAAFTATLDSTRVSLAAEVARTYVDVRSLQRRVEIARVNLANQTDTLQLTQWREQAGLVSSLDVEQARANREQTRAQVPALQATLENAGHRLAILVGAPPASLDAELAAPVPLPAVPDRIALAPPAEALTRRPDVRSAERTLAAETARVGQAEAARYPGFNLGASIALQGATLGALGAGDALIRSVVAGVTAPIFDGGRLRQQVLVRTAAQDLALANYESIALTALGEVEDSLSSILSSRERRSALGESVRAARNAAQLARFRYASGLSDFQSVLDTERTLRVLEDSQASADADAVTSVIQLYKALGGGWSEPGEDGAMASEGGK